MVAAGSPALTPVHLASLVDPSLHNPATLQLIKVDLSRNLIEYIVDNVVETVDYALGRPSSSRGRSLSRRSEHIQFTDFVADVIHKAEIKVPALLVTLVYIQRAKPHLQIALEQWACERVFLGALIVANKYANDSTLKNIHWALCTGVFGKRDIGRIEREFLDVLSFELGFTEADVLAHHSTIMAFSRPQHHVRSHTEPVIPPVRIARSPSGSRWSIDSSEIEMDVDSDVSSEPISSPRTPADSAPLAAEPIKPAALDSVPVPAPQFIVLPTPSPAHVIQTHGDAVYTPHDAMQQQHHHHHHPPCEQPSQRPSSQHRHQRMASALQLLHSFPIPYFHSRSSQPAPPQPLAHAHSHPHARGCRPMQPPSIAVPSATYAQQVLV
ncbi:uncharacterized protein LAESUDRAFT_718362 [Laetiporus sulphureus 93-53]|uniref:Cyclin N-terminal domain-containing protein n=1 Tax=Laetiporus sulphureus 93-53 TaxID=1314785 RepID=A0A165B1K8_9APHY|nr:uncharacterized protein LAESUDRAFT_718362 [Laetiporus sulphureus 93-53]KZT00059.1 hypothetical protein LAESUDRAFT_718362 [Laetiporus sulphureus 93-53]